MTLIIGMPRFRIILDSYAEYFIKLCGQQAPEGPGSSERLQCHDLQGTYGHAYSDKMSLQPGRDYRK